VQSVVATTVTLRAMAEYRNPRPPVDCIIRANPPIGWALPGGFLNEGETLDAAEGEPRGADDAAEAKTFAVDALPKDLCFDHDTLLSDDLASKRTGQRRKQ